MNPGMVADLVSYYCISLLFKLSVHLIRSIFPIEKTRVLEIFVKDEAGVCTQISSTPVLICRRYSYIKLRLLWANKNLILCLQLALENAPLILNKLGALFVSKPFHWTHREFVLNQNDSCTLYVYTAATQVVKLTYIYLFCIFLCTNRWFGQCLEIKHCQVNHWGENSRGEILRSDW